MKNFVFFSATALLLAACSQEPLNIPPTDMEITSSAFEHNGQIPAKYTCDGEDMSPPFTFSSIPEGTQSLILLVDDPDAPVGDWVHWIVYGIDPTTTEVTEDKVPEGGVEGITSWDRQEYGGPCPPSGTHRYFFKLFALDTDFDFDAPPNKATLLNMIEEHVLAKAELIGLYQRQK